MDACTDFRARSLRTVLLGCIATSVATLLVLTILSSLGLADSLIDEEQLLTRAAVGALIGSIVLWILMRYVSSYLAATLLLFMMTIAITLADVPFHVVKGRSLFWFALPIVAGSMLVTPKNSFHVATLASALIIFIGYRATPVMTNWVGIFGFYFVALVSWLSASTLENALAQSRSLSQELAQSEERYRSIFEHSLNGIGLHEVIRDAAGLPVDYRFIEVNQAFEQQTGLRALDIVGRTSLEVMPGTANQPFIEIYGRVVDSGEAIEFERYSEPLDRTYGISAFCVGQDQFVTIFADVSEQKRRAAEREALLENMRRQTAEMRLLMDTVPVGVCMLSEDHNIFMANAIAQELLEQIGQVEQGRLVTLAGRSLSALLQGPAQRLWQRLDAQDRVLEIAIRPMDDGGTLSWVLVIRDVTEEREFERRLQQQDRLAMIGQLAGGIAHDFNNLLTTILGYFQSLPWRALPLTPRPMRT